MIENPRTGEQVEFEVRTPERLVIHTTPKRRPEALQTRARETIRKQTSWAKPHPGEAR